jgi:hypothetical protein
MSHRAAAWLAWSLATLSVRRCFFPRPSASE